MKKINFLALAAIVIASLSAFKSVNTKTYNQIDGWAYDPGTGYCEYGLIDDLFGKTCDKYYYGPVCSINGVDAYATSVECQLNTINVLRKEY